MDVEELQETIIKLHKKLRQEIMARWNRSVTFDDELFDRWERAKFLGFGEGTSIYQDSLVVGDVKVGKNTWVGPFTILDGSGGLEIGDNCSISSGVHIYSHDTVKRRVSGGVHEIERGKTKVGSSCFIGPLSVIKKGVSIGDHSVIGALTFVNKDIPPYSIAVGVPCRIVGKVQKKGGKVRLIWDEEQTEKSEDIHKELEKLKRQIAIVQKRLSKLERGEKHKQK